MFLASVHTLKGRCANRQRPIIALVRPCSTHGFDVSKLSMMLMYDNTTKTGVDVCHVDRVSPFDAVLLRILLFSTPVKPIWQPFFTLLFLDR